MTRLAALYFLVLALSNISGGSAGPACARKYRQAADCVERCKLRWGWTGSMMGTDRWGSVITEAGGSADAWESIIAQACGSSVVPAVAASGSSTVLLPTTESQSDPVIATISYPAAIPTSAPLSVVSSVVSSSVSSSVSSVRPVSSSRPAPSSTVTRTLQSSVVSTTSHAATTVQFTPAPTSTHHPTTTQVPPPATSPANLGSGSGSGSGSTSSGDIQTYLTAHNTIRANHGAAALVWSNELASKAQQWANGCKFQHSGGSLGPYGENLAAGTGSSYGITQAVKSWTDEVSEYNGNNPQPSHFTQVVWKGSQQLGCAVQECDGIFPAQDGQAKYYVCEYFPAGNVIGEFAANVQV